MYEYEKKNWELQVLDSAAIWLRFGNVSVEN